MARKVPQPHFYNPQMPRIPGVPTGGAGGFAAAIGASIKQMLPALAVVCVLLLIGVAVVVRHRAASTAPPQPAMPVVRQAVSAPVPADPPPDVPERSDSGEIAPVSDLARPWSSKAFTYVRPIEHEGVAAMVIRLPGEAGGSGAAYWAFSLTEPFGTCQLKFVTDLAALANQYGYAATHPMVVDPCTQTVFDPLRMGQRTDGAWVRGEIVQGGGLRPPMAIEVSVRGGALYAERME
jgi:hypothetical protein